MHAGDKLNGLVLVQLPVAAYIFVANDVGLKRKPYAACRSGFSIRAIMPQAKRSAMRLGTGFVLSLSVLLARSQSTHTVSVGQFYEPPLISALQGDVVQFLFTAGHHGVTQASGVANPCSQLTGGFNSGIIGGFVANATNQPPTWSLTITNASAPIFFYCAATLPSFHCANGMLSSPFLSAINAEPDVYTSYSLAAKSVTGTPVQTSSVVISGVGAVATATPFTPTPTGLPATSTTLSSGIPSSTSESSSPLPSETSATSSKSSSKGAAIGGGVGGAAAVVIIALLGVCLYRAKRQRTTGSNPPFSPEAREKFNIHSPPMTPPGLPMNNSYQRDPFSSPVLAASLRHNRSVGSVGLSNMEGGPMPVGGNYGHQRMVSEQNDNAHFRATTYTQGSSLSGSLSEPPSGGHPGREFGQRSADSANTTFQPQPQYSPGVQGNYVNAHELAKEVATILGPHLRNANTPPPPISPPPQHRRALPNPHGLPAHDDEQPPTSPAPPKYDSYDGHQ
ncbi:uncharacterized protein FOMMEDRAFT_156138 [Fomitiporia mediterranea MF3/22]|uniref:uncharacterized protein n=1 Tax=Fomitiporia mediterranea (strain MF3/22) TaxID=694068 RepID=UPI0004408D2B|nr:uncharacterized protein FOMMEDRAFT_156138 [Fomitiporia mediterranea MF3/22]EJD02793.1 hypothetical protein FOMMEDRAFT_156138 [Fomitiporia mediterranea MF3/22]